MESNERIKEQIRKLINRTATKAELEQIQLYLQTAEGRRCFDEVMDETGGELQPDPLAGNDASVAEKLKLFKERNQIPSAAKSVNMSLWHRVAKYAAVLLIVAGAGVYFLIRGQNERRQLKLASVSAPRLIGYQNKRGQRATLTLSDGSIITLGPGSKVSYPESFTGKRRDVYLEGEAFFEVAKNPEKPFIVHSDALETRVIGTSFKIEAFKSVPLEVSVVTGKVRVSSVIAGYKKELATMMPGDHIEWFNGRSKTGTRDIAESLAWVDNKLVFHKQELSRILTTLERAYDVIIDRKKLNGTSEKISVTLNGRWPLNRTMNVLAATAGFKYKIEGRKVIVFSH